MRGRHRHVEIARFLDRFAAVHRLRNCEFPRPILNQASDAVEILSALDAREPAPRTERLVGGLVRGVDVRLIRQRDFGERLLGRRIDRFEILARTRRDELATDEQIVARFELRIGRLGGRIVLPQIAENQLRYGAASRLSAVDGSRLCHLNNSPQLP